MTSPFRVVFMGSDQFSLPVLDALVQRGSTNVPGVGVVGVVTQPDRPTGRGRRPAAGPVKARSVELGLPVVQPERLRRPDAVEGVLSLRPDLIVVAAYGQILPASLLDAPPHGCLNLHPSLLPRHRGASPVAGTILAGDRVTGTSVMVMAPRMDAGPIVVQVEAPVSEDDSTGSLERRLASLSADLLLETLPGWLEGTITPLEQDESQATYTSLLTKQDGELDWTLSAVELARRVRAFNPWPAVHSHFGGSVLRLLMAQPVPGDGEPGRVIELVGDRLLIGTGRGLLAVTQLQLAGGRPLSAREVLNGHRSLVGTLLGGTAS